MKQIPPFRLVAQPLDDEATKLPPFKWAPSDVGKRHRLGGAPDFIQPPEWPACPGCGAMMTFYGQLDSISDQFCIADAGMIYVFLCFDCYQSVSIVQSSQRSSHSTTLYAVANSERSKMGGAWRAAT